MPLVKFHLCERRTVANTHDTCTGIGQGAKPTSSSNTDSSTDKPPLTPIAIEPLKPYRPRYCCCFTSRLRCLCCFLSFILLILVVAALAIFFCYPRISNIQVSNPILTSTNTPLLTTSNGGILVRYAHAAHD